MHIVKRVAVAGVPNSGKTTLFNNLTGARQRVGNWPGVTVEKIEGTFSLNNASAELIDLPGTYNLSPDTEDQKVAEKVISSGEYDLILNVIDATNLSRNLYLTMDLKERTNQIIILLNMVDMAEKEGIDVNVDQLSAELGLPVVPVIAIDKDSVKKAMQQVALLIDDLPPHDSHATTEEVIDTVSRYASIDTICGKVATNVKDSSESLTNRIDTIVMNKFAAIPIFLLSMFITFWFAIGFGSVFIDFFDILGGLFLLIFRINYLQRSAALNG